jgi:methionyl-tRNA synthetase
MTNNNQKTFYITTTLPYVNGSPHIGFAMEIIRADILARHKRVILGDENVFFNTGTDEHGQKLSDEAKKQGLTPSQYVNKMSDNFKDLLKPLNISYDYFIRTTDKEHIISAQKFWNLCDEAGYIYKKNYQAKYCVGCELTKQDSDLVDGECQVHPGKDIQLIDEENYFFKWSAYDKKLIEYFNREDAPILPDFRKNEIQSFVEAGLQDFSISRLKSKMDWGVPVPGDENHVMYVWFDALVNYISALGWGSENEKNFEKFWASENSTIFQIAGKDNLRQQSAMWQAMLMAVGEKDSRIRNTDKIFINGFINSEGQKMSKSLGNVVDPAELVNIYGTDAVRYFVSRHFNHHEDSDFTKKRFHENYQSDLVNGLGNLTNRILAMSSKAGVKLLDEGRGYPIFGRKSSKLENYDFNGETLDIWMSITDLDEMITRTKPFSLAKSDDLEDAKKLKVILLSLLNGLWAIADWVEPIMPDTADKIKKAVDENEKPAEPLFPRIDLE